jgi:hypothetical protein
MRSAGSFAIGFSLVPNAKIGLISIRLTTFTSQDTLPDALQVNRDRAATEAR